MLRLKPVSSDDEYTDTVCAASRCQREAVVIDATRRLSDKQVPLCEHHWQARCELEPEEPQEMIIEIIEPELPTPNQRPATRGTEDRRPGRTPDRQQLLLPLD